ncbi:MAG: YCF48-related protein [Ignavibacteriota bacterium]
MKTSLIVLVILFLSFNLSYSQSGWYAQNTNTTNHILSVSFPNPTTGFACGWYGTLLKTTNGGDNWFSLNYTGSTGFQSIVFPDINTGFACGNSGTIIKTTNSGVNWFTLNSGTSNLLLIADFLDVNTGYVVGYSATLLKTTNSGNTWVALNSGTTVNLLSVKFVNSNTGYISGDLSRVLKTTDAGASWVSLVSGLSNNLGKIAFTDANTVYVPGTNGILFKTTNGGTFFTAQSTGNPNYLISANFKSVNTGYVSGANGTVIKTTNAGYNFVTQTTPTTNELHWIYFLNDLTGWACGFNGTILKTTTGGVSVPLPTVPVLVSPANNSNNISMTPILTWNASTNATSYTVQISTTPNFVNIIDSATVTSTQYTVPNGKLNPTITYFWRVMARNSYGVSLWSTVWNFSTTAAPSAPTLISPANNSVNVPLTPNFTWNAVTNATSYKIQISTSSGFATIVDSITTLSTNYQIPAGKLNMSNTYYWRVNASNSFGTGSWSVVWNFSTAGAPTAPVLLLPVNGALAVSKTPLMDWSDAAGATSYKILISTVSNFVVITDSSTVTTSQYQVPVGKLQDLFTYFWKVNASNSFGTSSWSEIWMFTVYPDAMKVLSNTVPDKFSLYQNYPNPFNPTTKIKFDLPKASNIRISVYDMKGAEVEVLLNGNVRGGTFEYNWNASKYSSGVYFVRLVSPEFSSIKRMVLIK